MKHIQYGYTYCILDQYALINTAHIAIWLCLCAVYNWMMTSLVHKKASGAFSTNKYYLNQYWFWGMDL